MFSPLSIAANGKGIPLLFKRASIIGKRYGLTSNKMDLALYQFVDLLHEYGCRATFPITSVVLARSDTLGQKYQSQGIEFAVHGYMHVDYSGLPLGQQMAHLDQARAVFEQSGVRARGFRCPYLRWSADTLTAINKQGFSYDSSQSLAWDVVDGYETLAYRRALDFYGARSAGEYPSLPQQEGDLIFIPYSLPDDESLVERLSLETIGQQIKIWLAILRSTHQLGELFTLGLHPERIVACREALASVLSEARSLVPRVWIARLDEIADWWRTRTEAAVEITDMEDNVYDLTVTGPEGTTMLARSVEVRGLADQWSGAYMRVKGRPFIIYAPHRPFIGVSPSASPAMVSFLQQQGYIVETSNHAQNYSYYFDQTRFAAEDKRPILALIEETDSPLVRLGRWPNGAQSALAVTGDIDALTLWDYGLRMIGK